MEGIPGSVGVDQRHGCGDQAVAGLEQALRREPLGDFLRGEALAFFPDCEHFDVTGGFGQTHPFNEAGEWHGGIDDREELGVLNVGLGSQADLG